MFVLLTSSEVLDGSYKFLRPKFSCQWIRNTMILLTFIPILTLLANLSHLILSLTGEKSPYAFQNVNHMLTIFIYFMVLCECITMDGSMEHAVLLFSPRQNGNDSILC